VAKRLVDKFPQAVRDLVHAAVYLTERSGSDDLAFRFLEKAEACFKQLAAMPQMGARRQYHDPALAGIRIWRIAGFDNYLVFYRPTGRGIEIIRVLHAKRDIDSMFRGRG
jgi:toxin ParE1/3/4